MKYCLLFDKIFENRIASEDNMLSIQSLGYITQLMTFTPLMFVDCDISDITLKSEGTITRRENQKKKIAELEVLN